VRGRSTNLAAGHCTLPAGGRLMGHLEEVTDRLGGCWGAETARKIARYPTETSWIGETRPKRWKRRSSGAGTECETDPKRIHAKYVAKLTSTNHFRLCSCRARSRQAPSPVSSVRSPAAVTAQPPSRLPWDRLRPQPPISNPPERRDGRKPRRDCSSPVGSGRSNFNAHIRLKLLSEACLNLAVVALAEQCCPPPGGVSAHHAA